MSQTGIKKAANCFIDISTFAASEGESPSTNVGPAAQRATDHYQQQHGGTWVGGRVLLQQDRISFSPNAANRVANGPFKDPEVKLAEVTSVEVQPAFFTKIIVVKSPTQSITFRCFGAPKFADVVRRSVAAAGGSISPS